ncbi:DnaD domain protein [Clostridium tarantellae]|uniref:DnaD domain protein n=1 Tax=Clostridium tarantellae TaxID=39493 RepID=A0A6I1MK52_9CLOT|nr:DnaD domain protein [Clostridium tarantellae]MPQ43400.1 DnaD domain protein [Clostridium tarantellae]
MSTFMLKNSATNFTPVNNIFIDKYMTKARGEFVKVYLLMLKYSISGELGVNSSILATKLNLLESDIMNALNYWNDEGVIKLLPIDKMNNFNIEFLDLYPTDDESTSIKVDLLSALNENNTKDMLKDIEKLIGRTLSPMEMSSYLSWQNEYNFSSELILLLIEYCASKGKRDSRYIEKVAISWYDCGITNIDEAQAYITKNEDKWVKIKKILNYLGIKNHEIMKPQEDILEKWLFTFNFSLELIFKACDICFERLNRADFKYIDGILTKWHKDQIKTLQDVATKDIKKPNQIVRNTNVSNNSHTPQKALNFTNYSQREYDYDLLEKQLLGWDD